MPPTLHTHQRGDGQQPVVLLHGFLGNGRNLQPIARTWGERDAFLRFVMMDHLGHGRSPALPEGAVLADLARAVLATLDSLGLTDPIPIVGHSLGGRVALACILEDASRVSRTTLLDIRPGTIADAEVRLVVGTLKKAPDHAPTRGAMTEALMGLGLPEHLAQWLVMNTKEDEAGGVTWRHDRESLCAFHDRDVGQDLWAAIEDHDVPVDCLRGGKSNLVRDEDLARIAAAGGRTGTLEGAGHFLHVEATEAVVDFLDG